MEIFERNLGACFYYLGKPEPALSNLRRYLGRRKDIAPDDKAAVDRWIDEMEKLRAQNAAASAPPAPPPAEPAVPPPAPVVAPMVTAPVALAPPPKADEPAPAIPAATSIPPAIAPTPSEAPKPAGVDLTSTATPSDSSEAGRPFWKTWWFWTGAVVVVGGAVTAIVLTTRSSDPCSGASMACLGVK
jgi:uncharacterized membrane protein